MRKLGNPTSRLAERSVALLILLALVSPHRAFAAAPDSVSAEALFQAGQKAMDGGSYAEACARFDESLRLDPAAGTLLNLAECNEKQGKVASAWGHLRHALDLLPATDERRAYAEKKVKELEPRLPRVSIRVMPALPPGAHVSRDGEDVGSAALGLLIPVDPGTHEITLVSGERRHATSIQVSASESRVIVLEAVGAAPDASRSPGSRSIHGKKLAAFGAAGGAIAGLTLGIASGLAAANRNDVMNAHCTSDRACDALGVDAGTQGQTFATVSTVSFIAAGVLLLGAGYLYYTAETAP